MSEASIGLKVYLDDQVSSGLDTIQAAIKSMASDLSVAGDQFYIAFSQARENVLKLTEAVVELNDVLKLSSMSTVSAASSITDVSNATKSAQESIDVLSAGAVQLSDSMSATGIASTLAKSGVSELGVQYADLVGSINITIDALNREWDAQDKAAQATRDAAAAKLAAKQAAEEEAAAQQAALERQMAFIGGMQLAQQGLQELSQDFQSAAKDMIQAAGSQEAAFTREGIALKATGTDLQSLEDYTIKTANSSTFSAEKIATAFELVGERTYSVNDIIQNGMGQSIINLAEATKSDVIPATNLLITAMRDFGASADQSSQYADILTYAFMNGIPNITQLQNALTNVGGTAAALNIPFSDLIGALTYMSNNGMPDATEAATSLRYLLSSLTNPTSKASLELANLGLISIQTTPQLQALADKVNSLESKTKQVKLDDTISNLQKLYNEALQFGLIDGNKTFLEWASGLGVLNNSLYDAKGNLLPLPELLGKVIEAVNKLPTTQDKAMALGNLFNVMSGQGARMMANDPNAAQKIQNNANAAKDSKGLSAAEANKILEDFDTKVGELKTSWSSLVAQLGMPIITALKPIIDQANSLVYNLQHASKSTKDFATSFVVIGAAVTPVAVLAVSIAGLVALFGWMAVLIGGAVVAAVIGFSLAAAFLVSHWKQVSTAIHPVINVIGMFGRLATGVVKDALPIFNNFSKQLQSGFAPIGATFVKTATEVERTLKPFIPLFITTGKAFGAYLVGLISIGLHVLIVAFIGLWQGVSIVIRGVINVLGGLIQFIAGFVVLLAVPIRFVVDIFKVGFGQAVINLLSNVSGAFMLMGAGIVNILTGLVKIVVGLAVGLGSAVLGAIMGLVSGVISFFTHLWDVLVGHSIIPDMIRSIIMWFLSLGPAALGAVAGLVVGLLGKFSELAGGAGQWFGKIVTDAVSAITGLGPKLLQAGQNAMNMLGNGIKNAADSVLGPVKNVASSIANFLGFSSPTKEGPLSVSDRYMPNMMRMLGDGVTANKRKLLDAVGDVAHGIHATFNSPSVASINTQVATARSQNGVTQLNLNLDGKQVGTAVFDRLTGELKTNGMNRWMR